VPRERISIDLSLPVFFGGAAFLSTLAYPDASRIAARMRGTFSHALQRESILKMNEAGASLPADPEIFDNMDHATAKSIIEVGHQLVHQRLFAARHYAIPFLKQLLEVRPIKVHGFAITVENMANLAAVELGKKPSGVPNIKRRIFVPAKPVLHAAAAVLTEVGVRKINDLLFDLDLLSQVITVAELYRLALISLLNKAGPQVADADTVQFSCGQVQKISAN
jgi:hypothetical protein